jgi:hypothetical protein
MRRHLRQQEPAVDVKCYRCNDGYVVDGATFRICTECGGMGKVTMDAETGLLLRGEAWVLDHPGVPFIHVTRNWGTHLIGFLPLSAYPPAGQSVPYLFGMADREKMLDNLSKEIQGILKHWTPVQWLYCDGMQLQPICPDEAVAKVDLYVSLIRRIWETGLHLETATPAPVRVTRRYGNIDVEINGTKRSLHGTEDTMFLLMMLLEADGHTVRS